MLALDEDEHAFALLRNQAGDDLLRHVLSRVIEQLFELQAGEAMDDLVFALDSDGILHFELVELPFLLKHVFD